MICPARFRSIVIVFAITAFAQAPRLSAQVKAPAEHLKEHDDEITKLQSDLKKLKKEVEELRAAEGLKKPTDKNNEEASGYFSNGVLTLGGVKLRLGGKAEILFIDPQSERDPIVGSTDSPDPHFEVQRLRLAPEVLFKAGFSLHSEIDFHPSEGQVLLKEMTARHDAEPVWWLRSKTSLGLDDRFIRPNRRTKNYPLIGNAFWRKETVALTWGLRFGDKSGQPPAKGKTKASSTGSEGYESDTIVEDDEGEPVKEKSAPKSHEAALHPPSQGSGDALNFVKNPGELRTYFSVGNGSTLNNKSVGFDGASFNDLVQDDREFTGEASIREVGLGLGYARELGWLGEAELLGFYYTSDLNDDSVEFLQQNLTVRDPVTGNPTAGYGDSNHQTSYRYGFGAEFFLPATHLVSETWKPKKSDGFRVAGQWIKARDGDLKRDGWYAQASYKLSFPERLLFDKYFRSVEPIVRYGVLDTGISATPLIPELWDRRQLLLGMIVEVIPEILIKTEYTFNYEDTGSSATHPGPSSVSNNELLIELVLEF